MNRLFHSKKERQILHMLVERFLRCPRFVIARGSPVRRSTRFPSYASFDAGIEHANAYHDETVRGLRSIAGPSRSSICGRSHTPLKAEERRTSRQNAPAWSMSDTWQHGLDLDADLHKLDRILAHMVDYVTVGRRLDYHVRTSSTWATGWRVRTLQPAHTR